MTVILHLSDLHFGQERDAQGKAERNLVLEQLIGSLHGLEGDWKPDIVCISGDIGFAGKASDYQKAGTWVRKVLATLGLSPADLILCPGNHDANRYELEGLAYLSNSSDADYALRLRGEEMVVHPNYRRPFSAYEAFCEELGVPRLMIGPWANHLVGGRIVKGIRFGSLNSAWFSKDDSDKEKLWLGHPHTLVLEEGGFLRAGGAKGEPCVVIFHHPPSWLNEQEIVAFDLTRPCTIDYLAQRCDVVLTGHTHGVIPKKPDQINGGARVVASGATMANLAYPNRYGLLKFEGDSLTVRHYTWEANSTELQRWKRYVPDFPCRLSPDEYPEAEKVPPEMTLDTELGDFVIYPDGLTLRSTKPFSKGQVTIVKWSPDGEQVSVLVDGLGVDIVDAKTTKTKRQLPDRVARCVAWTQDGRFVASSSAIWDSATWETAQKLTRDDTTIDVSWSKNGRHLAEATGTPYVRIANSYGEVVQVLHGLPSAVTSVAWSPTDDLLAIGCEDGSVRLRNMKSAEMVHIMRGHASSVLAIQFSPDGTMLATGSSDRTVRLWNVETGRQTNVFEGHTDDIVSLAFAGTEPVLASAALDDSIRLWRHDTEVYLGSVPVKSRIASRPAAASVCFSPTRSTLVFTDLGGSVIRFCDVDVEVLSANAPRHAALHYTNAKVVLVGDSGVGKSGLGLVLSKRPWAATESTHGRHVWTFDKLQVENGDGKVESREILLWDLAGQPGYRLIHQLYLNEVAVALVVFDGKNETDLFAGVGHWVRALRQAQRLPENASVPMKRILVAARADRGGVGVSAERLAVTIKGHGFDGFMETSAKENWGTDDLRELIHKSIPWDALPHINSTRLFERIKNFLLAQKQAGRMLAGDELLYQAFLLTEGLADNKVDLRREFETCISLVQARGLIRKLQFGQLILMQPEILDAYASAIVNAAKDQPDGYGSMVEEDVLGVRFRMSADERMPDPNDERLLLLAVVRDFIDHEIAIRETSEDGITQLVFPSQFTRDFPDAPELEGRTVVYSFEGAVLNVYATLAVKLAHSGLFRKKEMWRNAALYSAASGGDCGMSLRLLGEGQGELTLFFDRRVARDSRFEFEQYVKAHLLRRALPESVFRKPVFICPNPACGVPVSELQVQKRKAMNKDYIRCNVCDTRVPLVEPEQALAAFTAIKHMDGMAETERRVQSARTVLLGKTTVNDFDVLLVNKPGDEQSVTDLREALTARGLLCLAAKSGSDSTDWSQAIAGRKIKAVAVCVGPDGKGNWRTGELKDIFYKCQQSRVEVIPILLPGLSQAPQVGRGRSVLWVALTTSREEGALSVIESMTLRKAIHNLFSGQVRLVPGE